MDKIWKAKWIMDSRFFGLSPIDVFHKELDNRLLPQHRDDLKNVHMLVRKRFVISKNKGNFTIDITADDYYKLYINGEFVSQGPASAYFSHYNYNRHDIGGFLIEGENIIAVHVYYQGLINRVWNSGDYRQGMIAEIYSGDQLITATDASWKYTISKAYSDGGRIGYDTQFLENIDGRQMEYGWKESGFDDKTWLNACENITTDYKLYLQQTKPLEIYEIKPDKVKVIGYGHYLIDFGHELTGQFKMIASGKTGQIIEIRCAEELSDEDENSVRFEMRCNCCYREFWTLAGKESEMLDFFDYKAFRYVEVIGCENSVNQESFAAVVRHFPFDEKICLFDSSNDLLNRIWSICKNGVRYGTQENYVDCPSREKGQYLCDNTVISHSHMYLTWDLAFIKKSIRDFAFSTFICPGMMGVAPGSFMQEVGDASPQWLIQLLRYYRHSADLEFLKEMYPVAEKLMNYYRNYRRADGLLENVCDKWNMMDWPDNLRDDYDFQLSFPVPGDGCHNEINAFYYAALNSYYEIMDILGLHHKNELAAFRKSYFKAFYNKNTRLFVDSDVSSHSAIHSNMLPLAFGIVPAELQKPIIDLIKKRRISCGVYMAYFLLKALAAAGEYELLFDLLTSTDERSWGNMVSEGATTCFEAWGKEQKWNTSLCHAWASAPIPVIIEDIAGITPHSPGWEEIDFRPHIPESIEYMNLEFNICKGHIKMEYKDGAATIYSPEGVKVNRKFE